MTSICQELSESYVKIVLVNHSTAPVLLSLTQLSCSKKKFKSCDCTKEASTGAHTRLLTVKML